MKRLCCLGWGYYPLVPEGFSCFGTYDAPLDGEGFSCFGGLGAGGKRGGGNVGGGSVVWGVERGERTWGRSWGNWRSLGD